MTFYEKAEMLDEALFVHMSEGHSEKQCLVRKLHNCVMPISVHNTNQSGQKGNMMSQCITYLVMHFCISGSALTVG